MVAVRVAGDAAPLAPRVAALARQVDAGLHLQDIVTLDDIVAQEQIRMVADSVTVDLLVSSVITSVIMAAVGVLACAAPARRALRVQPTEALRQV